MFPETIFGGILLSLVNMTVVFLVLFLLQMIITLIKFFTKEKEEPVIEEEIETISMAAFEEDLTLEKVAVQAAALASLEFEEEKKEAKVSSWKTKSYEQSIKPRWR